MKYDKIHAMTDAELTAALAELRKELLTLKIQSRTGQLEKPARVRTARRDIARVHTEQTARAVKAND
ncbi:MAG: 50S ribosomal protein L29 [Victivallaceae bacterium]|nr:50S ribosomal protein L29 [Victivallaceae bacterium]